MIRSALRTFVVIAALGYSHAASALIDVQLMHGRRWASVEVNGKDRGTAYQHTMLAGHLGLLPFVSVGLSASMFDVISADKASQDLKSSSGTELGLDIMAAFSMVPIVTPYARLNLPLLSTFEQEDKTGRAKMEAEGVPLETYWFTAGIKYSIIPLLSLNLEAGTGVFMSRVTKYTLDGVDQLPLEESKRMKDRSAAKIDHLLVGVELGF